jgi:hypothetical protein
LLSPWPSHIPYIDDGTHLSAATAWSIPDAINTRVIALSFDCPSVATWSKVNVNDASAPLPVGIGIPNITALADYRPSLWAIGKTAVAPEGYQTDNVREEFRIPSNPDFKAIEYLTEGSGIFSGFADAIQEGVF